MKKINYILILAALLVLSFSRSQQELEQFYYCYDDKIYVSQTTDRIFVKFAQNASREQLNDIVSRNASLQPTSDTSLDEGYVRFAVLEAKDGRSISASTVESFMRKPEVVWATYMLQGSTGMYHSFTDEFLLMLKQTTSYAQLEELAEKNNCTISDEEGFHKGEYKLFVSKTSKLDARQMANLFYETGLFAYSAPNMVLFNALHSIDTYFGDQWGLKNTGQYGGNSGIDIKAEQAWTISQCSSQIKVAVIDNGVDLNHPDLKNNLLPGKDFMGNNSGGAPFKSTEIHGTCVAGIIGAIKDNAKGIAGVAPNCKIIPVRAYSDAVFLDVAARAIRWAWLNGEADVINCSWGGDPNVNNPHHSLLINAIDSAVILGRQGHGCVVVASSGNEDKQDVCFPANLPNVIAVGAISPCGERKTQLYHARL